MIRPGALKEGDIIGIIAPASPLKNEKVKLAVNKIMELGYGVRLGRSCYKSHGYLAGSDELRAQDINNMFGDSEIKAILCLRGGYGTMRILDMIDLELIKSNPKIFIGYSDITALHLLINQKCNLITFHGPMAINIAEGLDKFSMELLLRSITKTTAIGEINNPEDMDIHCLVGGVAEGKITGGNLSLITSTIGTRYEIDTKGKILFLEDVGEDIYKIDRMLNQLILSNKLQQVSGIILGSWQDCNNREYEKSLTLDEIFTELILPLGIPTIYNVQIGHCDSKITLPLGLTAEIIAEKGKIYIKEGAVI
ncbi:MAG: LD-carboxypeptidase [Clostridiales bacterium]|nr:LD-carboxypeptidase [Clostridiales bacterium]